MGPTGAGKSTFIEALAGARQSLGISKDQLEGFTQEVSSYKLENAVVDWGDHSIWPGIYLIDTPGFSDSKISEMEIINKVKSWMEDQGIHRIEDILYLTPITDTRVPGSKRRTITMLQSLLREGSASSVTIVTTMWNRVFSIQARERAEAHFAQLGSDIWKDLVEQGAKVVQFQNDQVSAIGILRDAVGRTDDYPLHSAPISRSGLTAPILYEELLNRISSSRQAIQLLLIDHLGLIPQPDPLLESVVGPHLQEAKEMLAKLLGQLVQFGEPPPVFEGVPEQVVYQDLLDHVNEAKQYIQAIKTVLDTVDRSRKSALKVQLKAAKSNLEASALALMKYGNPPKGHERLIFAYSELSVKGCIAQARLEALGLFKKGP